MLFWERLAEQRIEEAMARGEFEYLPGAGKPLPEEPQLALVKPELRMAYRIMKNAGYVPEEILLRREIHEVRQLLAECQDECGLAAARGRMLLLIERLDQVRSHNLYLEQRYFQQVAEKIDGQPTKKDPLEAGQRFSVKSNERRFNAKEEEN